MKKTATTQTNPLPTLRSLTLSGVLLTLIAITGCQDPQRAPLVGTWSLITPDRIAKRIDPAGRGESDAATVTDSTDASEGDSVPASKMTLSFSGNGQLATQTVMGNVNRQKKGTWEVISFDEVARKVTIGCLIGLQQTEHVVELIDDGSIRLIPPNMAGLSMKMQFERIPSP